MIDQGNIQHVYPINDIGKHIFCCEKQIIGLPICRCKCSPTYKEENGSLIVIHNSFDGREGVEWTIEILKK